MGYGIVSLNYSPSAEGDDAWAFTLGIILSLFFHGLGVSFCLDSWREMMLTEDSAQVIRTLTAGVGFGSCAA